MMLNRRSLSSGGFFACAALLALAGAAHAVPLNEFCEDASAFILVPGVPYNGSAIEASGEPNADALCAAEEQTPDVYHQFTPAYSGIYTFSTCASTVNWNTVVSIHSGCPATFSNEVACGDQGCPGTNLTNFQATLTGGTTYIVRVAAANTHFSTVPNLYTLLVTAPPAPTGACCLDEGCEVLTEADCLAQSGEYLGDNALCFTPDTASNTEHRGAGGMIPDGSSSLSSQVSVTDTSPIGTVSVRLNNLVHTYAGDLEATLSNGTVSFTLFSSPGATEFGDSSNFNGIYTLADSGTLTLAAALGQIGNAVTLAPATYQCVDENDAANRLGSVFNGLSAAGTWTLTINDREFSETGSLGSWDLILTRGTPACDANTCPADFNNDGARDVADLFAYINAWLAKTANADFNDSGSVDVADLFAYINAWLAGC